MPNIQLAEAISQIKDFKEFEEKYSPETMEVFPPKEFSIDWKNVRLNDITSIILPAIEQNSDYTQEEYKNQLVTLMCEIINNYNKIIHIINITDINKKESNLFELTKYYEEIKVLTESLRDLSDNPKFINFTEFNINNNIFSRISTYIIYKNHLSSLESFLEEINKENNYTTKANILNKLINFNNLEHTSNNTNQLYKIIFDIIQDYKNDIQDGIIISKIELNQEKNNIEQIKNKALEEIEKAKNSLIITAFKNKGESMNDYIGISYFLISLLFLLIIASLFFRLNTPIHEGFKLESFIYFISFITGISSLLAYLIKQNNRLVQQRDYFLRCHVELSALPTYVYDIEKTKIDSLKIELAQKYFTGGTGNETKTTPEVSLTNENIKQLFDIVKELTKKSKL